MSVDAYEAMRNQYDRVVRLGLATNSSEVLCHIDRTYVEELKKSPPDYKHVETVTYVRSRC